MENYNPIIQQMSSFRDGISIKMQELTNYLVNRGKDQSREISAYNWLLRYEDEVLLKAVINLMIEIIQKSGIQGRGICILTEAELVEKLSVFSQWVKKYNAIFIYAGMETTQEQWEQILPVLETSPEVIKVICAPDSVTEHVLKPYEHLYYRVFAKHMVIKAADENDIFSQFMEKLERNHFKTSQKFNEDIYNYITTVYPKAQLKETDFVNDLYRRIHTQYLQSVQQHSESIGDIILTEQYVPYYKKPSTYEEVLQELNSAPGLQKIKESINNTALILGYDIQNQGKSGLNLHQVYAGSYGMGKHHMAELYARLLFSLGVIRVAEIVTISADIFMAETAAIGQFKDSVERALHRVLYIENVDRLQIDRNAMKLFLNTLMDEDSCYEGQIVFILTGTNVWNMKSLIEDYPELRKLAGDVLVFDEYSDSELKEMIEQYSLSRKCEVDQDAQAALLNKIHYLKRQGAFENWYTVSAELNQAIHNHKMRIGNKKEQQMLIGICDVIEAKEKNVIKKIEVEPTQAFVATEQREENVLLLALSTISDNPKMYKYRNNQKDVMETFSCTGISQLEPGTKQVIYQLAKEGQKVNRIVIVESEETRTREISGISENFWDDPDYMKDKFQSAVCFYKQRILDYIYREYEKDILSDETSLVADFKDFEDHLPDDVYYSKEVLQHLFYDVPTIANHEKQLMDTRVYREESLELFVEISRAIKGVGGKKINLYIDTQGGARSSIQQINAVVELLKGKNVEIKGRYAIPKFNLRDQKSIYTIKEVGELYRSYDLVSAMTEFKLYARGKGLTAFFAGDPDPVTKQMIGIINQISEAIALCNMVIFENALDQMSFLKKDIEKGASVTSQIKLVFKDIIDNYSDLLKEERTQFEIVEWCVEHHYYQQAITIIESKMPQMLVESRFLLFDPDDTVEIKTTDLTDSYPDTANIKVLCQKMKQSLKAEWKPSENYLFEQWIWSNKCAPKETKDEVKMLEETKYFGTALKLQGNLSHTWKEKIEEFNECRRVRFSLKCEGKSYRFEYAKFDQMVRDKSKTSKMFRMFAALSSILKDARNGINHADSILKGEQIKDALETYIILGKELQLTEKWKKYKYFIGKDVELGNLEVTSRGVLRGTVVGTGDGASISKKHLSEIGIEPKEYVGKTVWVKLVRWDENGEKFNAKWVSTKNL